MEHMQRRTFLGSVVLAGVRGEAAEPASGQAFNRSGLSPEEYKRRFREESRRQGRRLAWRYSPGTALEPFLDWYPGDEWVSLWAVETRGARIVDNVNARSFVHEAQVREMRVERAG